MGIQSKKFSSRVRQQLMTENVHVDGRRTEKNKPPAQPQGEFANNMAKGLALRLNGQNHRNRFTRPRTDLTSAGKRQLYGFVIESERRG
jgi:hypothetical protein